MTKDITKITNKAIRLAKVRRALGNARFWRGALKLAIPIALQNLLVSSFSLVDTIMLGALGEVALSSVGMAGQWSWLLNLVLFGFNSGASVFIAQYWGVKDIKRIHNSFGIQLVSVSAISLVFMFVGFFFPEEVVAIFNKNPEVIATGASYLRIAAFSYLAVALSNAAFTLMRSTETVRAPMIISGITTALNAILNYSLIYGVFGLPALGVRGAAVATCISAWASPVIVLFYVLFKKDSLLRVPPNRLWKGIDRRFASTYYRISFPVILNETLWGLGTVVLNIVYGRLGETYYSAVTIEKTIENVFFSFFVGVCGACTVFIGKSVGSGKIVKAKTDAKRFILSMPILSTVMLIIVLLFNSQLVSVFNLGGNLSELTRSSAETANLIYSINLYLRLMPYITIVGIFRSGGDTMIGLIYEIVALWCISIPVTYVAAFVLKLPFAAVFAIMLVGEDLPKAILCLGRFKSGKWIRPVTDEAKKTEIPQ